MSGGKRRPKGSHAYPRDRWNGRVALLVDRRVFAFATARGPVGYQPGTQPRPARKTRCRAPLDRPGPRARSARSQTATDTSAPASSAQPGMPSAPRWSGSASRTQLARDVPITSVAGLAAGTPASVVTNVSPSQGSASSAMRPPYAELKTFTRFSRLGDPSPSGRCDRLPADHTCDSRKPNANSRLVNSARPLAPEEMLVTRP